MRVDLRKAGFAAVPTYFTSMGGKSNHWTTTGATSIYAARRERFDVYVRGIGNVTTRSAREAGWYINFVAIGRPTEAVRQALSGGQEDGLAVQRLQRQADYQARTLRRMRRQIRRLQRATGIRDRGFDD